MELSEKIILISLDVLIKYPEKSKRIESKSKYIQSMLSSFTYSKTPKIPFQDDLASQLSQYTSSYLNTPSHLDTSQYQLYPETMHVLDQLKFQGFSIIATSDSTIPGKPEKLIDSLGLLPYLTNTLTFFTFNCKKSSEDYLSLATKLLSNSPSPEFWVVSSRLDKEIQCASKNGLNHIWVHNNLDNIVIPT